MLIEFFFALRRAGLPVSIGEFLTLLAALDAREAFLSAADFYQLARTVLVKDERHYDPYDRVFAAYFKGAEARFVEFLASVPQDWLQRAAGRGLSDAERAQIQALGGWDALMRVLQERLAQQREAHAGGNKWIGTGGTSPFGAHGYNPEGVRIGPLGTGAGRAVKVWERRDFRDFDDARELDTRNFKMALRRLRRFAREGAADEFDLDATVAATAQNAGLLDLKLRPERRNAVKLLLLLDVGGSMDWHVDLCEQLFSAARADARSTAQLFERLSRDHCRRCGDESL